MSTVSPLAADQDVVPEGTEWPGPDTLVLLHRALRPDTDVSRLSRFADDRWNVDPAVFEDHARARSLNFALIPGPLRQDAKHYIWQLFNHSSPGTMRRANGDRPAILTIMTAFAPFKTFLTWLHSRGVTSFAQVTPQMLDAYLIDLGEETIGMDRKYQRVSEVRRLWTTRSILPRRMRLPAVPPWGGEDSRELFGRLRGERDNRTPRIGELTMQNLLIWAVRFIEDFAPDILAAHAEYLELHGQSIHQKQLRGETAQRPPRGEIERRMTAYLERLREHGGMLPGKTAADGTLEIDWQHIGRILSCAESIRRWSSGRLAIESGIPIAPRAYLDAPITGLLNGQPWRHTRISYHEASELARLLSAACFIAIAYLSGTRPGEALNLRRGCIEHDSENDLWLMRGLYYKNAVDKDGNKLPAGALRRDPWVVVKVAAQAVTVLERLHPHQLLFPNWIEPHLHRYSSTKRHGNARTDQSIGDDIAAFVTWVNDECRRQGRTDLIPPDGKGRLSASRFRRTLAWFVRRRPRGLVAASIQYGHLYTRLLQGYAGSYESGFPDEYAFEDWLYRIEILSEDAQALDEGEHVSGPAADAYRHRVTAATRQFAGHVLTSDGQARDLLGNPLLQIHHGNGMTCVLDPVQAACRLRGTVDDPLVTPDIDDCRPQCRNIARTSRDIQQVRQNHRELAALVDDPLAPPIRHERERHELDRLRRILDTHEAEASDR